LLPPRAPQADAAAEASSSRQASEAGASTSEGAQASQESSRASSSTADDLKGKVYESFSGFRSRFGGSSQQQDAGGSQQQAGGSRVKSLLDTVAREVKLAILPHTERNSATRAPEKHEVAAPMEHNPDGPSALAVAEQPQTSWQKAYEQFQDRFGHHPLFQKVSKVRVQDSKASDGGGAGWQAVGPCWSRRRRLTDVLSPALGAGWRPAAGARRGLARAPSNWPVTKRTCCSQPPVVSERLGLAGSCTPQIFNPAAQAPCPPPHAGALRLPLPHLTSRAHPPAGVQEGAGDRR
jgi:hypothetical protein